MRHFYFLLLLVVLALGANERINHEGRILPPTPQIVTSTLFNTAEGDAILDSIQLFPTDSAWNEDISNRPTLANSAAMISTIKTQLETGGSTRDDLHAFYEMNYVFVPASQALVTVTFNDYPDESDPSPYPIPANQPIETWPLGLQVYPGVTLTNSEWQQDIQGYGGDRHSITVRPSDGSFWETWQMIRTGSNWASSNGAYFNYTYNYARPDGWTSADAAGLPLFPGVVKYSECERGKVEHAIRCIVRRTRAEYLYPASHFASSPYTTDPNVPAMGERLRLKASTVIPDTWHLHSKAVAYALKKYGCIVADNGGFFSISISPDDRFPYDFQEYIGSFDDVQTLNINDFEVVDTTGPTEGPRSAGVPTVNAGPDKTSGLSTSFTATTTGTVNQITWSHYVDARYPSSGSVSFSTPNSASTGATFSAEGTYAIMVKVEDGVHTPQYDVVIVTVDSSVTNDQSAPTSDGASADGSDGATADGSDGASADGGDGDGDGEEESSSSMMINSLALILVVFSLF